MDIRLNGREIAEAIQECLVRRGVLDVGVYYQVEMKAEKDESGRFVLEAVVRPQPEEPRP